MDMDNFYNELEIDTINNKAVKLYQLLNEGYVAIHRGKYRTLDEVKDRIKNRREGKNV